MTLLCGQSSTLYGHTILSKRSAKYLTIESEYFFLNWNALVATWRLVLLSLVDCSDYEDVDRQFDKSFSPNVLVFFDSTCMWFPPGRFSMPCHIDISWFPFDDQICNLTFQSWQYDGLKLNLTTAYDTVENSFMNGEWSLRGKRSTQSTLFMISKVETVITPNQCIICNFFAEIQGIGGRSEVTVNC